MDEKSDEGEDSDDAMPGVQDNGEVLESGRLTEAQLDLILQLEAKGVRLTFVSRHYICIIIY
jgi:hypothetical protein